MFFQGPGPTKKSKDVMGWYVLAAQRALHSVLKYYFCTAPGTCFCVLCCQPVPIRRFSRARTVQPTPESPCTPRACQRHSIHTVCKTYTAPHILPPPLFPLRKGDSLRTCLARAQQIVLVAQSNGGQQQQQSNYIRNFARLRQIGLKGQSSRGQQEQHSNHTVLYE